MSVIQVGLVDTTGKIDPQLIHQAAAALNIQVTRDLPQFWNVKATVIPLTAGTKIPPSIWPVLLVAKLPPGEGGFHLDKHNQPFSKVIATPGSDEWTIDASHETLEMLVDPAGNRLQPSRAIVVAPDGTIQEGDGEYKYLVEACDPCEADKYAYPIQGVAVSDFLTPHFYDPVATPGTRYSFTGAIKGPRVILPGGYISWINLETNEWQQLLWVDPTQRPYIQNLGAAGAVRSLREWVDGKMAGYKKKEKIVRHPNPDLLHQCKRSRASLLKAAQPKSDYL